MTITIESEWDEGDLRASEITVEGRSVPYATLYGIKIHRSADGLSRLVGEWKTDEEKKNVAP